MPKVKMGEIQCIFEEFLRWSFTKVQQFAPNHTIKSYHIPFYTFSEYYNIVDIPVARLAFSFTAAQFRHMDSASGTDTSI